MTIFRPDVLDYAVWNILHESQMGVAVQDPDGHEIGKAAARKSFLDPGTWAPVDGHKHTLIGEVDRYRFYDGDGDEADFNIYITPNPAFDYILNYVIGALHGSW